MRISDWSSDVCSSDLFRRIIGHEAFLSLRPGARIEDCDKMDLISGRTAAEIATSVEQAIRTGRIGTGYKLPSVRDVAEQLGVNRNTVTVAYSRLRAAGLITGAGRQGSRVAGAQPLEPYRPIIPANARDLASGRSEEHTV